jgi:pimeloyl-ACP methyl ester carboxylesterase
LEAGLVPIEIVEADAGGDSTPAPDLVQPRVIAAAGTAISAIVTSGSERPVVLLHGNSSCKEVWAHQVGLLRRHGRPVLAPDLPGHGASATAAAPQTTYSFPGYAAVIRGLLDALDWDSVDIVGWSLGGHIGLELLATEVRVHSLLIVGTPPGRPSEEALREAFYDSRDMRFAGQAVLSEADAAAYGAALMGGAEQLTAHLLAAVRRTDGNARHWMFANGLHGIGANQRAVVEASDTPLCVVHGEQEPFVRLDYLRRINFKSLWNGRIHVIRGSGHAPHWQTPAAFNAILSGFLGLSAQTRSPAVPRDASTRTQPVGIST